MEYTQEQRALLWLSSAEISADRVQRLIAERGSARALWEETSAEISHNGIAAQTLQRLHSEIAMDAAIDRMERAGANAIFQGDSRYPPLLQCIDDPPYVLYCMGELPILPSVGVVGTRFPSGYGRDMARSIAYGLAKAGVCVVSGLARGIDGCAHEGTLDAQGRTIAVLGSGVNVPYPTENAALYRSILERDGAIISEFPMDASPQSYHFPLRNRIISGLCSAIVFVEGKVKSGGMLTVGTALQQGREVFAVPGRVGQQLSEGPHTIIREGARLVTSAADILEDLGMKACEDLTQPSETIDEPVSDAQRQILSALGKEALGLDGLCEATGLSPDSLMSELSVLEIMGQIRRESGNLFTLRIRADR